MSGKSPSGAFFGGLASWVQGKVDKSAAKAEKRNARTAHFRDAAALVRASGEEDRLTEINRAGLFKDMLSHSVGLAKPGTAMDFDYARPAIRFTTGQPKAASAPATTEEGAPATETVAEPPKKARTPRAKAPAAAKPAKPPRTPSTKPKKASA